MANESYGAKKDLAYNTKNLTDLKNTSLDKIIVELNAKYNFDTGPNVESSLLERFLGTSGEKLEDIESE